jgi:hypothetical protein
VTVDRPDARRALGRGFAALARQPDQAERAGLRVVSYPSTGDRRLVSADGRTTYALILPPLQPLLGGPDLGPGITAILAHALPPGRLDGAGDRPGRAGAGRQHGWPRGAGRDATGRAGVLAFVFGSLLALVPLLVAAVAILTTFLLILGHRRPHPPGGAGRPWHRPGPGRRPARPGPRRAHRRRPSRPGLAARRDRPGQRPAGRPDRHPGGQADHHPNPPGGRRRAYASVSVEADVGAASAGWWRRPAGRRLHPRPHRLHHHRHHRGHRPHRTAGHQRRADPATGIRVTGQRPHRHRQGLRHRAWRRDLPGRHRGPRPAGPRAGQPARPLELVATLLGRTTARRAAITGLRRRRPPTRCNVATRAARSGSTGQSHRKASARTQQGGSSNADGRGVGTAAGRGRRQRAAGGGEP